MIANQLVGLGQDQAERRATMFFRMPDGEIEGVHPPDSLFSSDEVFRSTGLPTIQRRLRELDPYCAGLLLPVRQHADDFLVCPQQKADGMVVCAAERVEGGVVRLAYYAPVHGSEDWREVHSDLGWLAQGLREAVADGPLEAIEALI
jgi:hypothetical protein